MVKMHIEMSSQAMRTPVDVIVLLPEEERESYPVLWLLHGMYGNYSDWTRLTSVERYASEAGIAVVMAAAENSYYEDMRHGAAYYTYFSEELPNRLRRMLPLSDKREDNFIAGLSMGGYGTLKLALRHPERYAAAASFSGVVNLAEFERSFSSKYPDLKRDSISAETVQPQDVDMLRIMYEDFGNDPIENTDADIFWLLRKHAEEGTELPRLFAWCGREDFLYQENLQFRDLCAELNIPLSFHTAPGCHEWKFWDMAVREFIPNLKK